MFMCQVTVPAPGRGGMDKGGAGQEGGVQPWAGRKLACARGGGSLEPLSRTPPPTFWAPVTATPDGLPATPNGLTGEVGGGGGS